MDNTTCILFLLLASIFIQAKTESYEYYANLVNQYLNDLPLERKDNVPTERKIDLRMPNVRPEKHDTYFCTSLNFPADQDTYIVGYEPHAEQHTAHHMLMFGCETPATQKKFWNCGNMGLGVCGDGAQKIMYAWGRNAPTLKLPKDVGFQIGGKAKERNLVLQVHYGMVDQFIKNPQLRDDSGVTLVTTPKRPGNLAGILLLASDGEIPPKNKAVHLDTGCRYYQDRVIHPFAFRVHAHKLGSVISGYRIRNNQWTLLGKGDPQRPQAFYPMDNPVDVRKDDLLVARCTYNSMKRDRMTYIGATMNDEMCNFYMMFYYDPNASAKEDPEACGPINENNIRASFPPDADKPLEGGHGEEMHMKRDLQGTEENSPL